MRAEGEAPDRPLLALVPGLDGTARMFYRQTERLAERFELLRFPYPAGVDEPAALASELARVLESCVPRRPAVVLGESMGGTVALTLAIERPDLVSHLVLVNTFARVPNRVGLALARAAMALVPAALAARLHRPSFRLLIGAGVPAADRAEVLRQHGALDLAATGRRLRALRNVDLRDRLGEIRVPALILAGDRDRLLPSVRNARCLARGIPRSTMVVLKEMGHACLVHPEMDLRAEIEGWAEGPSRDRPSGRLQGGPPS